MDRRSWLWRRKSSEKSPGEAESSGSVSSHSERYSDDQEVSKASPNHSHSPELSSNVASGENSDSIKSLTEKLSSALLKIRAKEDLVSQHAKVAEEAVSGWEKAEKEVVSLRQQLETTAQKNTTLEDRISQLDEALKECAKRRRESREDQEQKLQNALVKKTREWESEKFELESRLIEHKVRLEAAEERATSVSHDLQFKLEAVQKENAILKSEILALFEELNIRTLERDLTNRAAETASKQHLEGIKKVTKLEAECRRLQVMARKSSLTDCKPVEPLSDGMLNSGELLVALSNEPSCSDPWASALIAELDQFKSGTGVEHNPKGASIEIDLMDDFLEMEKLAALPGTSHHDSPFIEAQVCSSTTDSINSSQEAELKALLERMSELEEKNYMMETKLAETERVLAETQDRLEDTCKQLEAAVSKLADLQRQLQFANDSKQVADIAAETTETRRKLLQSELDSADLRVQELREKVGLLEGQIEEENVLTEDLAKKCQTLEDELLKSKREAEVRRVVISVGELKIKQEKGLTVAAGKFAECQKTIASLTQQVKSLATLDDLLCEGDETEMYGGSPPVSESDETRKLCVTDPSTTTESSNNPSSFLNRKETNSPPNSSSSSSSSFQYMQNVSLKVGPIVI